MTRLEENGHVELRLADSGGTYRITESGLNRLHSLLREPFENVTDSLLQTPLPMKIGFLHHLPLDEQRRELVRLKDQLQTARTELVDLQSIHETDVDDETRVGYRSELIQLRIFVFDAVIEWLDTIALRRSDRPFIATFWFSSDNSALAV